MHIKNIRGLRWKKWSPFVDGRSRCDSPFGFHQPRIRRSASSEACGEKGANTVGHKLNGNKGFLTLGHSNRTICSLLNRCCSRNFPPFYPASLNKQLLITPERGRKKQGLKMQKGNSPSKSEWDTVVSVHGAFKLDHLKLVQVILF